MGLCKERFAFVRQRDFTRCSTNQLPPDKLLKPPDLVADCGLSDIEPCPRLREAASLFHSSESPQQGRIDIHILLYMKVYHKSAENRSFSSSLRGCHSGPKHGCHMDEQPHDLSLAWKVTILFTAVIAATYAFGVYLFPPLMPDMRQSLGFGYAEAGGIAASRQIGFLVTALFSAVAVLRFGAGSVILGSVLLCGLALCGIGAAATTWMAAGLYQSSLTRTHLLPGSSMYPRLGQAG